MKKETIELIQKRLDEIELEHDVEIIYAIESGSRAWGFESTDSDYDVRFIYKHKLSWYLNILPKRDVIEYPIIDLFDYSGWDLRKALFLMNKSNPVLFEWLNSPIIYKKDINSYNLIKDAAEKYFSPVTSIYHYLHMAKGNYGDYLQGDFVKIKKYFYVLRPIFACMWVEKNNENPPIKFEDLLNNLNLDSILIDDINDLLKRKRTGIEMGLEPKINSINNFIENKLEYFESFTKYVNLREKPNAEYLDNVFYALLKRNV